MTSAAASQKPPEATELERRVLAHERVLQSLIAYMSRTEPRFVDHLWDRFVEPMKMTRHEHDYRDIDDFAEEFIRAVTLLGEGSNPASAELRTRGTSPRVSTVTHQQPDRSTLKPGRVQMQENHGIWQVTVDGAFRGDYHAKEQALAAMAVARLSLH
ncbi:MAG: hypothetical protein RLO50_21375 [Azospirillaceae bacterium]